MNCEWVERQLSAYHDSALDADTTAQVKNHLASCAHCDAVLDDFARFDKAIAGLPRVAPRPELRARIFASPEFQTILRNDPTAVAQKNGHIPPTIASGASRARLLKVVAQVAAIVVLLAGAGILIGTITAHPRHPGLIFAACPALSPGDRLVYRAGGTLHSGAAKLVCDPQVQVGATWQVSPDGQWIAYVNETTGALRIVRSDATGDHVVDTAAGTVVALSWSPDSQHLTIIKHDSGDYYRVDLATPASTNAEQYGTYQATQAPQSLTWAPDSQSLAWTFADTADVNHPQDPHIDTLVLQAPHIARDSSVGLVAIGLFTPTGAAFPTYRTYAHGHDGLVTAIDSIGFDGNSDNVAPQFPVSVNNAKAVAFSSVTGKWAVAQSDGTIATVDALTGKTTPLAHISNVTQLSWSPSGTYLTATSGTTLWLIAPTGTKRLATNVGAMPPTWGQHDTQLGFVANNTVMTADVTTGAVSPLTTMPTGAPAGLAWSAAGQLAAWSNASITLDGTATPATLTEAPQWSVAGS